MVAKKSFRVVTLILLILVLLLAAMPASAAPDQTGEFGGPEVPTNYCTSVVVTPAQPAGTYTIDAIGSGRWARCVRNGTSTVLCGPTDFGAGATQFYWTNVSLTPGDIIQVQTSHTSATSGYSTTGCVTTVPTALETELEDYGAWLVPNGAEVYWITVSEIDTYYFEIYRHPTPTLPGTKIATVYAAYPGSTIGAAYSIYDSSVTFTKARWYTIRAHSLHGITTVFGPFRAIAPPVSAN